MIRLRYLILAVITALLLAGCQAPTSSNPAVVQLQNPNNQAKAVQATIQAAGTAFLAKNPGYKSEVQAAANVFTALAQANPGILTESDIAAALSSTSLHVATQNEIAVYAGSALAIFTSSFNTQFPTLKVNYVIFLDALANGLNGAAGNGAAIVPLPVIPWPPATVPTPTPTPTASPAPAS